MSLGFLFVSVAIIVIVNIVPLLCGFFFLRRLLQLVDVFNEFAYFVLLQSVKTDHLVVGILRV